ncbi:MAG: DapH/DapD/GlmU-related protein, partial [Candidatus Poseidoniia archaeon]|nr:DapH/DapD/GlmU-related protein [Candidatus Poseidoniia archaeon]
YVKSMTEIGAGAFIGSNTALVAPVKVGDGAITGAGSVITKNVDADALALTRSDQKSIAGYAAKLRNKKGQKKGQKKGKQ